ncbi:homocitrate synthase/isopropylmalate synthase family protein [Desulfovibrio intestinalis]|uniref:2-isopropylmalate synthase/homocitrate synthase post-catalytic domain-containing protein n=1 Tax=Desulfovibrio intestinalis TaxID=58621 RepID=A0A7W8C0G2_9BACT|nr:hypothetical protein [Desulfovibrio intestinalis]MBB5143026.1 hypothetical protein [Desulfovibrio intestinalis]
MRTIQLLDITLSLFSTAMRSGPGRRRPKLSHEEFTSWAGRWQVLLQDMGFLVEIPSDLLQPLHDASPAAQKAESYTDQHAPLLPAAAKDASKADECGPTTVRTNSIAGTNSLEASNLGAEASGAGAASVPDGQSTWLRMGGCDDALPFTELGFFDKFITLRDVLEFCPGDQAGCATALAVLWLLRGGKRVAGSIGGPALHGTSSGPALEEVALCLESQGVHTGLSNLHKLPEAVALLRTAGFRVSPHKAVLGDHIFAVESGIHVDGIAKNPALYETYPPESVGLARSIVIGKHSGRAALRLKTAQLGIDLVETHENRLLAAVQKMAMRQQHSLSDRQFAALCASVKTPFGKKRHTAAQTESRPLEKRHG